MMIRKLSLFALLLMLVTGVFAQPDPNQPAPNPGPNRQPAPGNMAMNMARNILYQLTREQKTLMVRTDNGLFVLRTGVLAKYQPDVLNQPQIKELFPAPMAMPVGDNPDEAKVREWAMDVGKRLVPAVIVPVGHELVIIIGEWFFRIDSETLEVKIAKQLLPKNPLPEWVRLQSLIAPPSAVVSPKEPVLYLSRGQQLLAVNINTGELLSGGVLPEKMQPERLLAGLYGRQPDGGRGGGNPPGRAAQGAPISVVGTVTHRTNPDSWGITDDEGNAYLLAGDQLEKLKGTAEIVGRRVRVNGRLLPATEGQPAGVKRVEITNFEVLNGR
ncbi:MAG: hypothetical protein ACYDBB_19240 [Armatimonadota bacterium]